MKELSKLNDIQIDIKRVKESIEWQNKLNKLFSRVFRSGEISRIPKLELQITNLENRRKRIIRKMFNQYCK